MCGKLLISNCELNLYSLCYLSLLDVMGFLDQKRKLMSVEGVGLLTGSAYVFHAWLTTTLPQMVLLANKNIVNMIIYVCIEYITTVPSGSTKINITWMPLCQTPGKYNCLVNNNNVYGHNLACYISGI